MLKCLAEKKLFITFNEFYVKKNKFNQKEIKVGYETGVDRLYKT